MKPAPTQPLIFTLLLFLFAFFPACSKSVAPGTAASSNKDPNLLADESIFVETETTVTETGKDPDVKAAQTEIYIDRDDKALMVVDARRESSWHQYYLKGTTTAGWFNADGEVSAVSAKVFKSEAAARHDFYKYMQVAFPLVDSLLGNESLAEDFTATEVKEGTTRYKVNPEPVAPVFQMIAAAGFTIECEVSVDENGRVSTYANSQLSEDVVSVIAGKVTSRKDGVPAELMKLPAAVTAKIEEARAKAK